MIYRLQKTLAVITSIGAYIMVLMGAIVTKTASGTGCGSSWPFCQGQLIPATISPEAAIEYSHRLVSGFDGALIVALALWTWFAFRNNRLIKLFGGMSVFFVLLQGGLGALTVMFSNTFAKDFLLALHFGFSLLTFASVVLLCVVLFQVRKEKTAPQIQASSRGKQLAIWGLAIYTYLVVYTGSLVRHMQATMACGHDFPTCGTTYLPGFDTIASIQVLHRYAAGSLWLFTLIVFLSTIRNWRSHAYLFKGSLLAFALVNIQALSGLFTVLSDGQLLVALVHTTCIAVYFSVICALCLRVGTPWKRQSQSNEQIVVAS